MKRDKRRFVGLVAGVIGCIAARAVAAAESRGILEVGLLPAFGTSSIFLGPGAQDAYLGLTQGLAFANRDAATGRFEVRSIYADAWLHFANPADGLQIYADINEGAYALQRNPLDGSLSGPVAVAVVPQVFSPDGGQGYQVLGGFPFDQFGVYSRNIATGATALQEVHQDGVAGVDGLFGTLTFIPSPDGKNVYVLASEFTINEALVVFSRDAGTGSLTFLEVHRDDSGGADGLESGDVMVVSPDGLFAYVGGEIGKIAVFSRNPTTGALTFVGTHAIPMTNVRFMVIDPAGERIFVQGQSTLPPFDAWMVLRMARDPGTGLLNNAGFVRETEGGVGSLSTSDLEISPDGRFLYLANDPLVILRPAAIECAPLPLAGCHATAVPGKGSLDLRPGSTPAKNKLDWKWPAGTATAVGDFGTPAVSDIDYAFCLYDGTASGVLQEAIAPAVSLCATRPCWKPTSRGVAYRDGKRTPDGLTKIVLVAGTAGKAQLKLQGKGELLALPSLPLVLPARAQLQAANGQCWEATFNTAVQNDAARFLATAD